MLTVACLLSRPADASTLATRLRPRAAVHPFDDRGALVRHVRSAAVAAVVVDLRDGEGRPTSGTVRALRALAPRLPVLARCRLAAPDCRALLDFARAGGTDVLVEDGYEPLLATLHADEGTADGAHATLVARLLAAGIPSQFAPLLEHLFAHLDDPDAARSVADRLGVSQRSLERRLARASLPSPRTLQSWCRLIAAADRLQGDAVAVERVAHAVGFSSGNALRNALQRYGETTPSSVRAAGGLDALIGRLCGHGESLGRHVAERVPGRGVERDVAAALAVRAYLLSTLAESLGARAVAAGVGRRSGCASAPRDGRILLPRSRRGKPAPTGGRSGGGKAHDRRTTC